jgi:prepilin-type N-terminal cleavage/methylation domain-containing protein
MKKCPRISNQGFSLVELAIVLVIVGLILGMGMGMMGPLQTRVRVNETRESLSANIESVTAWAASNNRIADLATYPTIAKAPNDAWGQNFMYLYDSNLAPAAAATTKDTICGRKTTPLILTTANPAATINNVAFVIMSKGDDTTTQSTLNGTLNGAAINGIVTGTGRATGTITQDPDSSDILRWVTLDELRSKIGCQGAQLKILNNELPYGTTASYQAVLSADGGVSFAAPPATPTYKWCVSGLPAGLTVTGGITNANCWAGATEATWGATVPSSSFTISRTAAVVTGSYKITVVARDNHDGIATSPACSAAVPGDNCSQKNFVITINP